MSVARGLEQRSRAETYALLLADLQRRHLPGPGHRVPLKLMLTNPGPSAPRITTPAVPVASSSVPLCTPSSEDKVCPPGTSFSADNVDNGSLFKVGVKKA
jgi:hypothetical protein